jgi:hypothetical protein
MTGKRDRTAELPEADAVSDVGLSGASLANAPRLACYKTKMPLRTNTFWALRWPERSYRLWPRVLTLFGSGRPEIGTPFKLIVVITVTMQIDLCDSVTTYDCGFRASC